MNPKSMPISAENLPREAALALQYSAHVPFMTREAFAVAIGLPVSVLTAQAERGYWPEVRIGKRVFINVELVRKQALEREFAI
jgi:hypothetical protein